MRSHMKPAVALLLLLGAACSPGASPTPTVEPIPTPSPTPTLVPTATPTPPPTTIPAAEVTLGETVSVEHGGFSYRPVIGYQETHLPGMVVMSSDDEEVLLLIQGGLGSEEKAVEDEMEMFLTNVAADSDNLTASEPLTITIDQVGGLVFDIQEAWNGENTRGRIACAIPSDFQFFYAVGMALEDRWLAEGTAVFQALMESVSFFEPTPMENQCPVTADPNYGYSKDSAIRVGEGDFLSGPSLERAYLDQLRGPDGQAIEYERLGSESYGITILDAYHVTYDDVSVVLYLDMYQAEPFRVPVGFTCAW